MEKKEREPGKKNSPPSEHFVFKNLRSNSWRCSVKKVFLKISQISQEKTYVRSVFLIKFQALKLFHQQGIFSLPNLGFFISYIRDLEACNFIKKRLQHSCFPMKFAKFLRITNWRTSANDCFWNLPFDIHQLKINHVL